MPGLIYLIVVALEVIAGVYISRSILIRKLHALMHANPTSQTDKPIQATLGEKVEPTNPLTFFEINAATSLKGAVQLRESLVKEARLIFRNKFFLDILAGAGYMIFAAIALLIIGDKQYIFTEGNTGGIIGSFLILYSLGSFLTFRSQFRAYGSGFLWVINLWDRFRGFLSNPRYSIYFAIFCIVFAFISPFIETNGVVLDSYAKWALVISAIPAVAVHIYLWVRLYKFYREKKNYKLLILRVFDIDENAKFTFKDILKYWKHFGSFFTVADPSFFKSQIKMRRQIIWLILLSSLLTAFVFLINSSSGDTSGKSQDNSGSIALGMIIVISMIAAYFILSLIYKIRIMRKNVISSHDTLENKLKFIEKWPRRITHTFRDEPVICYDSTWQMAVARFVAISQTILMDLRGFTDKRKGCETEVKLLLDTTPLKRLTFLVDEEWNSVKNLLQECWKSISSNSPNITLSSPQANIYIATRKNNKDIQGIMDTLLNAAIVSAPAG